MACFLRRVRVSTNYRLCLLAFFWCLGSCAGYALFLYYGSYYISLMYMTPFVRVSIVGLLCVLYLPFLLSNLAMYHSLDFLVYLIAFSRSFLFSFLGCCTYRAFANAGWLIHCLCFFSPSISTVLLFALWCRYIIAAGKSVWRQNCVFYIAITLIVGFFDYFVMSSFLQSLFY